MFKKGDWVITENDGIHFSIVGKYVRRKGDKIIMQTYYREKRMNGIPGVSDKSFKVMFYICDKGFMMEECHDLDRDKDGKEIERDYLTNCVEKERVRKITRKEMAILVEAQL
jgi:hypothetical protein